MSVTSMMEMNSKSPFLWDWENLVIFNTKTIEPPKKSQLVDPEIEGIEGFEVGSYFSSATGSDLGYVSSSRSSKSASVESSPDKEVKGTSFTMETNHSGKKQEVINKREWMNSGVTQTSSTIESSVVSGESLIALELGKRTYFEDVSATTNAKNSAKKSKLSSTHTEVPRCQVEGCNLDLSNAKDYHRKHKVCENHSKCPRVVINGIERRFCQQCSRFHGLTEFDQKKRSCRRRLSDHNARRRKPKPEVIQFNSMRLTSSSLYEGRNQLNFAFNQGPVLQNRGDMLDSTNNTKVTVTKPSLLTSIKTGGTDELHSTHNGFQIPESKVSTHLFPSKGSSFEVYQRGIAVSVEASNMEAAQDQQRALSLLSTTSWGSCDPSLLTNQPSLTHPFPMASTAHTHAPPHPLTTSAHEYWQVEEPGSVGLGSHGSTFQLFKAPNEPGFYLY